MAPTPADESRLEFLDAIRGVAALAVAVQHTAECAFPSYQAWSVANVNLGVFGVVAFFLVSGFIIPASLERAGSLGRFWIGRFFRLYPLYWVSLAFAFGFGMSGFTTLPAGAVEYPAEFLLANATMFQEVLGQPHAIASYWTLAMELAFYILCSVLFLLGLQRHSLLWAWLAVLGMGGVTVAIMLIFHSVLPAGRAGLIVSAFVGVVLYRVMQGQVQSRELALLLVALAVVLTVSFWLRFDVAASDTRELEWSFRAVLISWVLAYAFVLLMFVSRRRTFGAPLRWLGKVSYSVYLVHPLVLALVPGAHFGLPWMVLVLGLVCGISGLCYAFVEAPFITLGKRVSAHMKSVAAYRPV